MIPVALDTNILVSALITPGGRAAFVIATCIEGGIQPCFTDFILREYAAVCHRTKLAHLAAKGSALTDLLASIGRLIRPVSSGLHSPDPTDTMFIDCAVAAGARFLVTGNKRHFPEPVYGPAEIVNAATLLARLAAQPT